MNIIIPTSEIIQPRLFVVHIPPIPEGLHSAQCSSHTTSLANGLAPGIVNIAHNNCTSAVKQCHNVTLQVLHIAVRGSVVNNHRRLVLRVVEEVQLIAALSHMHHILAMQRVVSGAGHPACRAASGV